MYASEQIDGLKYRIIKIPLLMKKELS